MKSTTFGPGASSGRRGYTQIMDNITATHLVNALFVAYTLVVPVVVIVYCKFWA